MILAVAGSAVGLGNFLRFPSLAATYGGGAFLIPYFAALLFLGIPLMWIEWAFGRLGGVWGRHSLPGIFSQVTQRSWGKYLGVLGLYLPFIIVVYYLYVESWALGYTFIAATGQWTPADPATAAATQNAFTAKLFEQYLGVNGSHILALPITALIFLGITLLINFYVVYRGVEAGIEKLNSVAMWLLLLVSAFLMCFLFTIKTAVTQVSLNMLWSPELLWKDGYLANPEVWLVAAGQVFFTLSLAVGVVITYTSCLRKEDDVALGGLTAVSYNTLAEIVLGASVIFPVLFIFLTPEIRMTMLAHTSPYEPPFVALPYLFEMIPFGQQIGAFWFLLLFFAGVTSSVSLLQPILAFFNDELGWSRRKGTTILLILTIACLAPVVLLQKFGFLKEMDFWAVSFLLPVGALVEVAVFLIALGIARGWEGITAGAFIRVPKFYRFVIQYVMPVYLAIILGWWLVKNTIPKLRLDDIGEGSMDKLTVILARVVMGIGFLIMLLLLRSAWRRRLEQPEEDPLMHTVEAEAETVSIDALEASIDTVPSIEAITAAVDAVQPDGDAPAKEPSRDA